MYSRPIRSTVRVNDRVALHRKLISPRAHFRHSAGFGTKLAARLGGHRPALHKELFPRTFATGLLTGDGEWVAFVIGPDGHNIEAVCHAPEV